MSFDLVWAPIGPSPKLAAIFGGDATIPLPHFIDQPNRRTATGGIEAALNAKTLGLGILVTGGEPTPVVDFEASPTQLRVLLSLVAADMRAVSEDELCASAAAYLRDRHNDNIAIVALRHASTIVPDGVAIRSDLIASLFSRVTQGPAEDPISDLAEVADRFLEWQALETRSIRNIESILHSGLAALTYLGRQTERDAAVVMHLTRISQSPLLQQQISKLRLARPGYLDDIQL